MHLKLRNLQRQRINLIHHLKNDNLLPVYFVHLLDRVVNNVWDKSPIVSILLVLLQTNKNTVKYNTVHVVPKLYFLSFRQRMKRMLGLYQRSWKRITLIINCGLNNPRIMPPALQWNRIRRRRSRSSSRNLSSLNDINWLVYKMYHGLLLLKRLPTVTGMQVFKLLYVHVQAL